VSRFISGSNEARLSILVPIADISQVGEARRRATVLASTIGFSETDIGKIAIIATELANNLIKHAITGQLILTVLAGPEEGLTCFELLSLDRGPGIVSIPEALRDGFSTAGSPGTGLGAIRRLSSTFHLYTQLGIGTVAVARVTKKATLASKERHTDVGVICLPYPGERACGDGWAVEFLEEGPLFMVVDGLGHGPGAEQAAEEAIHTFRKNREQDFQEIFRRENLALRSTRGAALSMAQIRWNRNELIFAGIGNVSGAIARPEGTKILTTQNGTLGTEPRQLRIISVPWSAESLLIMNSDGLMTQWRLDRYSGLITQHPSIVAGILYRDFNRGTDDVTVLAVRTSPGADQ